VALAGLALAGCSWFGSSRYDPNPQVYGLNDTVPEGGGRYKVGDPYVVDGQRFFPREQPDYDQSGIASWYGEYFHGRKTANGEWYDMNRLSAAHPTLPLPVYARVTNLENGRSLVVRVNDRGPFRRSRVIDLSKGAATQLGMVAQGTAPVRVTYISRAPLEGDVANMQTVDRGMSRLAPSRTAAAAQPWPAEAPADTGTVRRAGSALATGEGTARSPGFYVQAASFTDQARAQGLADELAHLGSFQVLPAEVRGDTYFRVRLGPFASAREAESRRGELATNGLGEARVYGP
jgi:rare lipoprotein A